MIFSLSFIVIFILIIAVIVLFRKRYGLLFFLIVFCPTLLVTNNFCSDRSTYSTQKVRVANLLISCIDVAVEFCSDHHGMRFSSTEGWYYDTLFLIEVYSLLLVFFMYWFLRKYSGRLVVANFKYCYKIFYSTIYAWGLLLAISIITVLFLNSEEKPIGTKAFSDAYSINLFSYLLIYFILLSVIIPKYFYLLKEEKFIMLFLVLLFPAISISGEYNALPICDTEESNFENHLIIYPLIYAIPKTILSFFQDFNNQKYPPSILPKIYSLLQIALVIFLFPSLFNVNNEDKKLRG